MFWTTWELVNSARKLTLDKAGSNAFVAPMQPQMNLNSSISQDILSP